MRRCMLLLGSPARSRAPGADASHDASGIARKSVGAAVNLSAEERTMSRNLHLELQDERLPFDAASLPDGRHLVTDDLDGSSIYAEVRSGKIESVHGERDGKQVEAFLMISNSASEGSGLIHPDQMPVRCYLCACSGDSCTCRRVPCPGGGG